MKSVVTSVLTEQTERRCVLKYVHITIIQHHPTQRQLRFRRHPCLPIWSGFNKKNTRNKSCRFPAARALTSLHRLHLLCTALICTYERYTAP